jgi:hypothetical protein
MVSALDAQTQVANPVGMLIVAEAEGTSSINTGNKIEPLKSKSVYPVEGSTLETQLNAIISILLSNGTGVAFTPNTNLQFTIYQQAPFAPNRNDLETEPSNSQTLAFLERGGIGVSTSKLLPGSTFTLKTRHAGLFIQGGKLFIECSDLQTTVTLLEGNLTIRDELKPGGVALTGGKQAVITRQSGATPAIIRIKDILNENIDKPKEAVDLATMVRRTVYFDISNSNETDAETLVPVAILPGKINGPNTVSPFKIVNPAIQ